MEETPVKVAVRIRPLLPKEILHNQHVCVRVVPNTQQIIIGKDRPFTFDFVFGQNSVQDEVYITCIKPLVSSLIEGYNVTVFAYGQTGSGKTYTLGGGHGVSMAAKEKGIIPRAIQEIFQRITENHITDYTVKVSYIEVYKEELRDLLDLDTSSKDMHIREDEKRNTVIVGAKECLVESADEVIQLLEGGNAARHTGTTQMNEFSSRSHAILTISVDQQVLNLEGANRTVWNTGETSATSVQLISSKFHFVDLAGSERVTKTGNTGERFKESVQINSGLLALGNVISALGDPRRKSQHVPYRDSKITRILKDSLGGNAKTLMIACISPSSFNFDESLNSLKYANRARSIRNKPIVNYNPDWDRINEMELEIQALRQALQNRRGALVNRANQASQSLTEEQEKIRIRSLEERLALLQFECCHYRNCTEDAFRILLELKGTASLPKNQLCKLQEWIDVTEGFQADNSTPRLNSTAEEEAHLITCLQLKRELKKCQDALAADEKAFSQKEAELKQLQARINTVLQENKVHLAFLDEEENKQKLQKEKMVEQQLLIDRLRQQLQGNNTILYKSCLSTDGTSDNDSRCVKRSYSVPHQSSQTESFTATKVTQRTSKKSDTSHVFCCLKHSNFDRNRRANLRASARSDPGVSDEITAEKRSTEETTNMTDDIFKSRHSMPKSSREMKYEFSALMDQMYYWRLEDQKIREQDKEDQKWQRERDKEESKRQREEVQEESRRQREEDQRKQEEDRERFTILLQVIQTSIQEGHKQQQQLLEEMKQHVKSIQEQQEKLCRGVQKEVDNSQNSAPKMEEGFSCDMRDIEERVRYTEEQIKLLSNELSRKLENLQKEPSVNGGSESPSAGGMSKNGFLENGAKILQKPTMYEGQICWEDYHAQFEIIAQINGWDDAQKACFLAASLKGPAMTVLGNLTAERRKDYRCLTAALSHRFGTVHQAELARAKLKNRTRKTDESLPELAEDIQRLVRLAYAEAPAHLQDTLGRDQFIDSLTDEGLRLRLRQEHPKNLREALELALELESYQLANKQWNRGDGDGTVLLQIGNNDLPSSSHQHSANKPEDNGLGTLSESKILERQQILQQVLQEIITLGSTLKPKQRPDGCWNCGQRGHIARHCRTKTQDEHEEDYFFTEVVHHLKEESDA